MSELIWHIETRKIKDLKPYYKNPRTITKDRFNDLKCNIEKFGLIDKPFINIDNTIIGGHQRVRILQKMNYEEIQVQVPNRELTAREVEELNYRHNENGGSPDYDILADQYNLSDLLAWGQSPLKEQQEREPKKLKPKVIFEFESENAMEEQAMLIEEAAVTWNARMKIKK